MSISGLNQWYTPENFRVSGAELTIQFREGL
jgi:hypothetical protein